MTKHVIVPDISQIAFGDEHSGCSVVDLGEGEQYFIARSTLNLSFFDLIFLIYTFCE